MKPFFIFVGGTGQHVACAFIRLKNFLYEDKPIFLNENTKKEEIAKADAIFIDGDFHNPKEGSVTYNLRNLIGEDLSIYFLHPCPKKYHPKKGAEISKISFKEVINNDRLYQALYEKEALDTDIFNGFFGKPQISSLIFQERIKEFESSQSNNQSENTDPLLINFVNAIETHNPIVIIGSYVGGTGAGVIPTLANFIKNKDEKKDIIYFAHHRWFQLDKGTKDNIDRDVLKANSYTGLKYLLDNDQSFDWICFFDIAKDFPDATRHQDGGTGQGEYEHFLLLINAIILYNLQKSLEIGVHEKIKVHEKHTYISLNDKDICSSIKIFFNKDIDKAKKNANASINIDTLLQEGVKLKSILNENHKLYIYLNYLINFIESEDFKRHKIPIPDAFENDIKANIDEYKKGLGNLTKRQREFFNYFNKAIETYQSRGGLQYKEDIGNQDTLDILEDIENYLKKKFYNNKYDWSKPKEIILKDYFLFLLKKSIKVGNEKSGGEGIRLIRYEGTGRIENNKFDKLDTNNEKFKENYLLIKDLKIMPDNYPSPFANFYLFKDKLESYIQKKIKSGQQPYDSEKQAKDLKDFYLKGLFMRCFELEDINLDRIPLGKYLIDLLPEDIRKEIQKDGKSLRNDSIKLLKYKDLFIGMYYYPNYFIYHTGFTYWPEEEKDISKKLIEKIESKFKNQSQSDNSFFSRFDSFLEAFEKKIDIASIIENYTKEIKEEEIKIQYEAEKIKIGSIVEFIGCKGRDDNIYVILEDYEKKIMEKQSDIMLSDIKFEINQKEIEDPNYSIKYKALSIIIDKNKKEYIRLIKFEEIFVKKIFAFKGAKNIWPVKWIFIPIEGREEIGFKNFKIEGKEQLQDKIIISMPSYKNIQVEIEVLKPDFYLAIYPNYENPMKLLFSNLKEYSLSFQKKNAGGKLDNFYDKGEDFNKINGDLRKFEKVWILENLDWSDDGHITIFKEKEFYGSYDFIFKDKSNEKKEVKAGVDFGTVFTCVAFDEKIQEIGFKKEYISIIQPHDKKIVLFKPQKLYPSLLYNKYGINFFNYLIVEVEKAEDIFEKGIIDNQGIIKGIKWSGDKEQIKSYFKNIFFIIFVSYPNYKFKRFNIGYPLAMYQAQLEDIKAAINEAKNEIKNKLRINDFEINYFTESEVGAGIINEEGLHLIIDMGGGTTDFELIENYVERKKIKHKIYAADSFIIAGEKLREIVPLIEGKSDAEYNKYLGLALKAFFKVLVNGCRIYEYERKISSEMKKNKEIKPKFECKDELKIYLLGQGWKVFKKFHGLFGNIEEQIKNYFIDNFELFQISEQKEKIALNLMRLDEMQERISEKKTYLGLDIRLFYSNNFKDYPFASKIGEIQYEEKFEGHKYAASDIRITDFSSQTENIFEETFTFKSDVENNIKNSKCGFFDIRGDIQKKFLRSIVEWISIHIIEKIKSGGINELFKKSKI